MDAVKLLKQDHRSVEALFKKFNAAGRGATQERKRVATQIIKELSVHASIEEQFLYPAARQLSEKLKDQVLESLEEHHVAKATLAELDKMPASDERYNAKMTVLMENIRHHVKEEEADLFPRLQKLMSKEELDALGTAMAAAKTAAPTHPHPMAPDTPPGNFISGALAKILDSGKDMVVDTARSAQKAVKSGIQAIEGKARGKKKARG